MAASLAVGSILAVQYDAQRILAANDLEASAVARRERHARTRDAIGTILAIGAVFAVLAVGSA